MATLTRLDPFGEMMSLRDAMDRLFEDSFVRAGNGGTHLINGTQTLAIDLYETDNDLVVEASLPGISPDEVDISVVGNSLTITGETKYTEQREEKGKYYYHERRYGTFQRNINLPVRVNSDKAQATFQNGILKLTLPKVEEAKPKHIPLKAR
jgi:HSP20 family protein